MLTFLATIFIIYLLWILIKPLLMSYARRKYAEKVNDMFNQAFGGGQPFGAGQAYAGRNATQDPRRARRETPRSPGRKKKIFSREEGEYIEFEEIEVRTEYRSTSAKDSSYTPREPQVSDADWEEIR